MVMHNRNGILKAFHRLNFDSESQLLVLNDSSVCVCVALALIRAVFW